jgi:hypothetical protein
MTIETQIANVITTLVAVVLLWSVCRFFVVPALVDHLRYRLFKIRREMFLFMADGGIHPDNIAYGRVRAFMNTAIRYANGLSLARAIVGAASLGDYGRERIQDLESSINALPAETRNRIDGFRKQASTAIAIYMVVRSPLGWLLMVGSIPVAALLAAVSIVRSAWAKTWSRGAFNIIRLRAEEETQMLRCMEDDGLGAAA